MKIIFLKKLLECSVQKNIFLFFLLSIEIFFVNFGSIVNFFSIFEFNFFLKIEVLIIN